MRRSNRRAAPDPVCLFAIRLSTLKHQNSKYVFGIVLLSVQFLATGPSQAAGDPEAGQAKAGTCAACHGANGVSLNPEWPSLAGQNENYIVRSLKAYKNGTRDDVLMVGQVMSLSDQDMADIGAFYASQPMARLTADPDQVAAGERLYRGGNKEDRISACIACHGPNGRGNGPAAYPAVSGQHASYTQTALRAYKAGAGSGDAASGARTSDPNQMMRNIAQRLTDDEIEAVASYMQGLR